MNEDRIKKSLARMMNLNRNASEMGFMPIRTYMLELLALFIETGVNPGDFLMAVLRNDLCGAAAMADKGNRDALATWGMMVREVVPMAARRDPDAWKGMTEALRNLSGEHR